MKYFVIRHKPTGEFMPARMFLKSNRGYTYWEPTGLNGLTADPARKTPRLFQTEHAAKVALTVWLKGIAVIDYNDDGDPRHSIEAPPMPRIKSDMEIVAISLTIIEGTK